MPHISEEQVNRLLDLVRWGDTPDCVVEAVKILESLPAEPAAGDVDEDAILDVMAKADWQADYPRGGSVYKTYESTQFNDQESYRAQHRRGVRALIDAGYFRAATSKASHPRIDAEGVRKVSDGINYLENALEKCHALHIAVPYGLLFKRIDEIKEAIQLLTPSNGEKK